MKTGARSIKAACQALRADPGNAQLERQFYDAVYACVRDVLAPSARFLLPWYLQGELEDVCQDALFALLQKAKHACASGKIDLERRSAEIQAYIRTIARNALRTEVKRSRKRNERRPLALLGDIVGEDDPTERWALTQDLLQLLKGLGSEHRTIIAWRLFEQLSYAQIGKKLGISAVAAKARYHRAIQRLREAYGI